MPYPLEWYDVTAEENGTANTSYYVKSMTGEMVIIFVNIVDNGACKVLSIGCEMCCFSGKLVDTYRHRAMWYRFELTVLTEKNQNAAGLFISRLVVRSIE
jgi:hypothetical protein